jgi:diguanylate cyclase (GGDEF)-like protein
MLAVGDFNARVLGLSLVTVAVLMIRFVASQYDLLAKELTLRKEVHDLANTDLLTGLPNRRAIVAALEGAVASSEEFAVALLDLDGFKGVNDKLGHLAGDQLLRVVAARLTALCTASHTIAGRLGGDEFLVIFRAIDGVVDVSARADALLAALCQPTTIEKETVHVRTSIGVATFPADGRTPPALLAVADAALYAHKRARGASAERSEDRRRYRA